MSEINSDKLPKEIGKLLRPIKPVRWSLSIIVPRATHPVLRKLAKCPGNGVSIRSRDDNDILLIDDNE